ncbi:MAG TPA: hypothetical protein PLI95_27445, partial [Polyangiaceae bacterium]|nr:hypothetical protein [Polyangiaceae bacterium]
MRASLHGVWGCARGPVTRLAPPTRLVAGAGVFGACMIAPAATPIGSASIASIALSWLLACGVPWRVAR